MADFSAPAVSEQLEGLYAQALERLEAIRQTWVAEGQPLIGTGSTGQEVEHPLVRLLRDSEAHVARLGEAVRRRAPGRPAEAVFGGRQPHGCGRSRPLRRGAGEARQGPPSDRRPAGAVPETAMATVG